MSAKIYTKKGDSGSSRTLNKLNIPKSNSVFEVLGTIDELSASLGLLPISKKSVLWVAVKQIQTDLFKIGALFAGIPIDSHTVVWLKTRVLEIEQRIDKIDAQNKPLVSFILPGGSAASAYLHYSRTICRRTERVVAKYLSKNKRSKLSEILVYLNRLSDYLFVSARYYNEKGKEDTVWKG